MNLPPPFVCASFWSKAKGLMFKTKVEQPLIFVFDKEKRHSLHMLFVFCPIDVLFLDRGKKVVEIKENFKPFAFYMPKKPCTYLIELPAGAIKKSGTALGDRIEF
jgi:uncharacterized membrane protein (UPF0127 family)